MPPAARITDLQNCPMATPIPPSPIPVPHVAGPIMTGSPNVITGMMPQARVTDMVLCAVPIPPNAIAKGSLTVFVNNLPAARIGDLTMHGGAISTGFPTVIIGDGTGGGAGGAGGVSLAIARMLVTPGGSGTAEDAELVAAELAKLPPSILARMLANGTRVVACRGSVTDYRTELQGVAPRGWPAGSTWDNVPGSFMPGSNEVVIATIGHPANPHVPATGEGHGSANLVVHEGLHGYDKGAGGHVSDSPDFAAARAADTGPGTSTYEQQAGVAGQEESYAESGARYYSDPAGSSTAEPNLGNYWAGQ